MPAELDPQLKDLLILLRDLNLNKFYGELVIKYENGKVVLIRKTQNIKI